MLGDGLYEQERDWFDFTICVLCIRERCFTRLTPGQLLDTTMDKV